MIRFPSGVTDQYLYFVAVDATDLTTRETGLTSFTVYRIRNAANSPVAYTTPTITEVSAANMPGVYSILLDEDMTITSGDQSNAVCLHITQAAMAPVTLLYELYRPDVTAGETLTVASGVGQSSVQSIAANAITAAATAADFGTEIAAAVWDRLTSALTTVGSIGKLLVDNINVALSTLATQTSVDDLPTNAELATALGTADDAVLAEIALVKAKTDNLPSDPADQSVISAVIDAIKVTTDKLDDTLEDDGGVYRFTVNALEQAPLGGGGGGGPTAEEIADEVQTRTIAAVTLVNGLAANTVNASALASDAVAEIQSGLASQTSVDALETHLDSQDTILSVLALEATSQTIIADIAGVAAGVNDIPNNAEFEAAMADLDADFDAVPTTSEIVAAVFGFVVEGSYTFQQVTAIQNGMLAGLVSGAEVGIMEFKGLDGTSARINMTGDQYGNRTAVSYSLGDLP